MLVTSFLMETFNVIRILFLFHFSNFFTLFLLCLLFYNAIFFYCLHLLMLLGLGFTFRSVFSHLLMWCFMPVTMLLCTCHSVFSHLLMWCFMPVTMLLCTCHSVVSHLLMWCSMPVTMLLYTCHSVVSHLFVWCIMLVTLLLCTTIFTC